jgi:hypothetical protein
MGFFITSNISNVLDVGCWMLDVGCWMLDVGCWFDLNPYLIGERNRLRACWIEGCLRKRQITEGL